MHQKDMVIEMNNLANAVQKFWQRVNAYYNGESILDVSVCISQKHYKYIPMKSRERENRLDELYMLINKIEEYEDKLIN